MRTTKNTTKNDEAEAPDMKTTTPLPAITMSELVGEAKLIAEWYVGRYVAGL